MFGSGFLTLGPHPAFFARLRAWVRQTLAFEFQVSEFIGPVPVVAKAQEAKLVAVPKPFTVSAKRAPPPRGVPAPPAASSPRATPSWAEMRSIMAMRRQIRRRKGWSDLRRRQYEVQAMEEREGLLAEVE